MNIEYRGKALSIIVPVDFMQVAELPQLWVWLPQWEPPTILAQSLETVDQLVAEGFTQSDAASGILETQLYKTVRVTVPNQAHQTWYKADSQHKPPSVMLAFSVESRPEPQVIPMLNPFPLPQFGEYGFIHENDALIPYHIMNLPLEARQRWATLGDMLRNLSSPLMWPAFTDRHALASREQGYHNELHSLTIQRKLAIEPTRTELLIKQSMLEAAHMHIENLHSALKKANLTQQWGAVQRLARDLAQDYYEYHQRQKRAYEMRDSDSSHATTTPEPREEYQPVPVPNTSLTSNIITRTLLASLRSQDVYKHNPEQGEAEHQFHKNAGQITIKIKALDDEGWETVMSALNTLGDGCVDTFIACWILAAERNGFQHIRTPFLISPDDILGACKKTKSNGSYTPKQRADVTKYLKTLSQAYITASMPSRPSRFRRSKGSKREETVLKAEGAVIDLLSFKIGEYSAVTGKEIWEKRSIAMGAWISAISELSNQTIIMLCELLAYSGKKQRYQKRLGIFLTLMFSANAHKGGMVECSMNALLEGAGIIPDKDHPDRFKKAIEDALLVLKRDKKIGEYTRIIDGSQTGQENEQKMRQLARNWPDIYNAQRWQFVPPDHAKELYKEILRGGKIIVKIPE